MEQQERKYNIKDFKVKTIHRTPLDNSVYKRWGYRIGSSVAGDFTLEEILELIRSGEPEQLRELSRYFYRTNSIYRNNIDFLARLFLYETVIIPVYPENKGSKA